MTTDRTTRLTRPAERVLALLGAATLLVVGACSDPAEPGASPTPTDAAPTPSEPAPEPSDEPTEEPGDDDGSTATVLVYFMADTRNGLRLTREPRDVTAMTPVTGAVEAMLEGPQDPDYVSPWAPGTELLGISEDATGYVVDLSGEARETTVGSEGAVLMVQQLVWTVSQAAGDDAASVMLHVDGEPAGELWGAVVWDEPVTRAEAVDVRQLVGIDSPGEGATVTSPLTVTGEAAAFEANVPWRVLDADGNEVQSGFTMTTEGQRFAPYELTVDLEPGTWTIEVMEDDPSGGEGGTPSSDTRTVTVPGS